VIDRRGTITLHRCQTCVQVVGGSRCIEACWSLSAVIAWGLAKDRALEIRFRVIDLCQLPGQNGDGALDVVPACAHRSCRDRIGEACGVADLRSFQNGIDAGVEAGHGAFERRDHVPDPHCRRAVVFDFLFSAPFVLNETLASTRANALWVIPALGHRCLEIVLVRHGLPRFGTSTNAISTFRPDNRKKLAKGACEGAYLSYS